MDQRRDVGRLETPSSVGYRAGMSSCGVIGRKLSSLYSIPDDTPEQIDDLIEQIDRSVAPRR